MIVIATTLGDRNKLPTVGASELSRELILHQREFCDFFRRDITLWPGYRLIVVINTVHHEVVITWTLATDGSATAYANAATAGYVWSDQGKVVNT